MYINGSSFNSGLGQASIRSLNNLQSIKTQLDQSLEAIGTGYKFNSPAENPAGSVELARLQAKISSITAAANNNEQAYDALSGVDSAQSTILKTLMEIRTAVQDAIGQSNPTILQTLVDSVSSKLGAIDNYANSVAIGGKRVLAGSGGFDLSAGSALLNTADSSIRSIRSNVKLNVSFDKQNAAQQAVISDNYNLPVSSTSGSGTTESVFRITTDTGSRTVHLVADIDLEDAVSQINTQLDEIGVHSEINAGKIHFISDEYGNGANLQYTHVSGSQFLASSTSASDRGVNGSLTVNGRNYALAGTYSNNAPQQATLSGAYAGSVLAGTTITIATSDQTGATYTFAAGTTIDATAIAALDSYFSSYGVRVGTSGSQLYFKTTDYGNGEVLSYQNTGTQLLTDGASFFKTGRDYVAGSGLALDVATTDLSAKLVFDPEKVVTNALTGVSPDSASFGFNPEGGILYQLSDEAGYYDSIRYGFADVTSEGLGADQLVDNSSPFYMLTNPSQALKLVDSILSKMRTEYSALGSFMGDFLERETDNLNGIAEALFAQQGSLADVNEAYETSRIVKLQLLQQANISALSTQNAYGNALAQLLPNVG